MSDTLELRRGTTRRQVFSQHPIDGQAVKRLVYAGMTWLKTNQAVVNALNVFPVPDGDTGTNMLLTMQSAINEIEDSGETHMGKMLGAVAQGALMGARGNSGVILSQLWRGFARAIEEEAELTAEGVAKGFAGASETAYKGVVRISCSGWAPDAAVEYRFSLGAETEMAQESTGLSNGTCYYRHRLCAKKGTPQPRPAALFPF